ncbi:MAG: glycosyltransferase [Anaerolineae bacterium]|nr:glycosyltransferase [Anaerolineae bacterium]
MLGNALDSVLTQSHTHWEAIVVDDGSMDDTKALMARYTDPRIRYIYQANTGLPGARNTGIRHATGELIALLDSDDAFLPRRLEKQIALFEADPEIGVVVGGCIEADAHLKPTREVQNWHTCPDLDLAHLLIDCPFCPSAVMLRREWLDRAGGFDETMKRIEDWDLWLRLAHLGCKFAWLREAACYYRIHGSNMVRDVGLMRDGMLTMLDKLYAHDGLPADVLALRNKAYANVYLNTAGRAYAADTIEEGRAALGRASRVRSGIAGRRTAPRAEFSGVVRADAAVPQRRSLYGCGDPQPTRQCKGAEAIFQRTSARAVACGGGVPVRPSPRARAGDSACVAGDVAPPNLAAQSRLGSRNGASAVGPRDPGKNLKRVSITVTPPSTS